MNENHAVTMKIVWVRGKSGKFTSGFITNIDFNFHVDILGCIIAVTTRYVVDT